MFNVDGFYSAIWIEDIGKLVVRARFKEDLEKIMVRLGARCVIDTSRDHDYPYRIFVTKEAWSKYVAESAMNIDYPNFKDRVLPKASLDRDARYHKVWAAMAFPDMERGYVQAVPDSI